jgi:hypothetical protein
MLYQSYQHFNREARVKDSYFCPKQALGPRRNGLLALRLSVQFGSSQRSGWKTSGSLKFLGFRVEDHICTETVVCEMSEKRLEGTKIATYSAWNEYSIYRITIL